MPACVETVIFFVEAPFRQRDYKRFGLEILSRNFQVLVLDCSQLLHPAMGRKLPHVNFEIDGYVAIQTIHALEHIIVRCGGKAAAIDFMFAGRLQTKIRRILRKNHVDRIQLIGTTIPRTSPLNTSLFMRFAKWIRDGAFCRYYSLRASLYPVVPLPIGMSEITILSGQQSLSYPSSRSPFQVWAHHFDYDSYREERDLPRTEVGSYALFVDQDFVGNTDRMITGTAEYVTPEKYYSSLNRFFSDFEDRTGLPVVIAAHPKSEVAQVAAAFEERRTVQGSSVQLARDASLIFGHYSLALSFGVLCRKPIVLLSTNELLNYYLYPCIEAFSRKLSVPIVNVDEYVSSTIDLVARRQVSADIYQRFEENYIKAPHSPDKSLWEIVSRALRERA